MALSQSPSCTPPARSNTQIRCSFMTFVHLNFGCQLEMNFMPSEDTFFDEPLHNDIPVPQNISSKSNVVREDNTVALLLESSLRQEKLLERLLSEIERVNRNLINIDLKHQNATSSPAPSPTSAKHQQQANSTGPTPPRGNLLLPPGSRPATVPNVVKEKAPELSAEEIAAAREKSEQDAILRRRAEEEARIARIEAERIQKEAEEERKRLAELRRIEEEKRMKEELEKKTRGLMTGLLTTSSTGGLFGDDDLDVGGVAGTRKGGGLFDD
jgi:hypothetical protein